VSGKADMYSDGLIRRLQKIAFAGSTDGCRTVINAVQQLKADGRLPILRYQFRDRPHTTRTVVRMVLRLMKEGERLRETLITGKKSFAKRALHSKRFALIWRLVQKEDVTDIYNIFQHLAYKEYRYDSRASPMMIFCSKLGAMVKVLIIMKNDTLPCHRLDRLWAIDVLNVLQGVEGFHALVCFAIESDFAFATHLLTKVQDESQPDASLTAYQAQTCLDTCEVLFLEGAVFSSDRNGTFTSTLLHGLRERHVLPPGFFADRDTPYSDIGWPTDLSLIDVDRPLLFARDLYSATKLFFDINYPDHSWRAKFGCFNEGEGRYAESIRLTCVEELAVKEDLCPVKCRNQFCQILPLLRRHYSECLDNREALIRSLEVFRVSNTTFRSEVAEILELSLSFIGLLDATGDCERTFAKKNRLCPNGREMCCVALKDSIQISQEVSQSLDCLVDRMPAPVLLEKERAKQLFVQVAFRPGKFILKGMSRYAEFYGQRRLASRSLVPVSVRGKASKSVRSRAPVITVKPLVARAKITKVAIRARWMKSVSLLVAQLRNRRANGEQPTRICTPALFRSPRLLIVFPEGFISKVTVYRSAYPCNTDPAIFVLYIETQTLHTYIYIYIYVCSVCVSM
jgi:hypothetical protein